MHVRFRKTVSLFGGLAKINLNKKSASISVGIPGLGVTLSNSGDLHYHAGLPGTGISCRGKTIRKKNGKNR